MLATGAEEYLPSAGTYCRPADQRSGIFQDTTASYSRSVGPVHGSAGFATMVGCGMFVRRRCFDQTGLENLEPAGDLHEKIHDPATDPCGFRDRNGHPADDH